MALNAMAENKFTQTQNIALLFIQHEAGLTSSLWRTRIPE